MKKLSQIFSQWLLTIFLLSGVQFTAASQTATHLHFDGVNDFVNLPVSSLFNFGTGDFTAEAWIKTSNTNTQVIAGCFNSNSNNFWLGTTVSGTVRAAFSISGTTLVGTSVVNNNQWHHIAGVRQAGVISIYVDGILETSVANTLSFTTLSASLKIGNFNNAFYFSGEAEEVRIWNAAQTAGNIAARRNIELVGNESGLLAYYKFNQGIAAGNNTAITTLTNSTANPLDGTITNFSLTGSTSNFLSGSPVPQPQGTHLNFDGVNDFVNIPSNSISAALSGTTALTMETWVKSTIADYTGVNIYNTGSIFSNHRPSGATQFSLRANGTRFEFFIGFGAYSVLSPVNAITPGTWQHIAAVFNGSTIKLYINGLLIGTTNTPGYSLSASAEAVRMGNSGYGEQFNGNIDEVRIWNSVLSADDIVRRKNCELQGNEAGLYAYYKFNQGIAGGTNTTVTSLTNSSVIAGLNGTLTNMVLTGATSNWLAGSAVTTGSTIPAAPTATAQSFCGSGTVANLVPAPSATINWYNVATGGTALAGTTALATGTYYVAAVNANGCESNRTSISITINAVPAPPVASAQNFCGSGTVANLSPAPSATYNWYNVATGGSALAGTTALATGPYYVSASNVPGCESARTTVNVTISNSLIYVKADATGANDGTSWANAYTSLQSALQNTCAQSIWVAAGTYKPSTDHQGNIPADLRNKQFYIKPALKIYGGFAGNETSLSQRNIAANPTILDGDIGTAGDNTDNCYHVVVAVYSYTGFPGVTIDGFHIRNGNANGTGYISYSGEFAFGNQGGGIFISALRQSKIMNNNIYNNTSSDNGAGMYFKTSFPSDADTISNNIFSNNNANAGLGGGMYLQLSSTGYINGNVISNNSAAEGGGIYSNVGNTAQKIVNNIIYNNTAATGAGVYFESSRGTFAHNTLLNNNASVAGGGAYLFDNIGGYGSTVNNNIFWLNKQTNSSTAQGADFAKGTGGQFYVLKNNSLQLTSGNYTSAGSGAYDLGATATGNLFAQNPLFLNAANPAGTDAVYGSADDGLQVLCASPMLNTGLAGTGITNDIVETVRNIITPTIGAYETANVTNGLLATSYQTVTANQSSTTLYGSCSNLIASVQSNGALAVNGSTTAKVWIEGAQNTQFVKRHYEITPTLNTATATGKITLYFTQAEFDDFNAVSALDLPTGSVDATGKANLLIEKRSGVSSDGSGLPGTYTGTVVTIDPADADIVWNSTANRWEVSFDVTGFSGFFVKTISGLLPISLINFTAAKQANEVLLQWQTNNEINFSRFEVQRSINGSSFETIGTVTARNAGGNNNYQLTDNAAWISDVRYYRLKIIDNDGTFKYSTIVRITNKQVGGGVNIYPNPVKDVFTLQVADNKLLHSTAQLFDASGKLIKTISINNTFQTVDISNIAKGMYLLKFEDGSVVKIIKE